MVSHAARQVHPLRAYRVWVKTATQYSANRCQRGGVTTAAIVSLEIKADKTDFGRQIKDRSRSMSGRISNQGMPHPASIIAPILGIRGVHLWW